MKGRFRRYLAMLMIIEWSVLAVVFTAAPWWSGLNGPWPAIWESFAVDPPELTRIVASLWNVLIAGYPIVTAVAGLGIVVAGVWLMRVEGKAFGAIWWLRSGVIAIPLIGIAVVFLSLYSVPREQLAQLLNLPHLPRYVDFPVYRRTVTDNSRAMEERRQALYSLHTMRVLEQGGVFPPAQRGRDSSMVAAETLLTVCCQEQAPTELRLFAAGILHHEYIGGEANDSSKATIDVQKARRCVFEVYVDVVRDGGPAQYAQWQNSAYELGQWAGSAFANTQPPDSIVDELRESLTDPDPAVRAEAGAALRAVESANGKG